MRQIFSEESPDEWRKSMENKKQIDFQFSEDQPVELTLTEYKKYKEEIKQLDGEKLMDYIARLKSFPVWKVDSVNLFEDRWRMKYGEDIDDSIKKGKQLDLF